MRHPEPPETVLVYVGLDLIGDGLMKLPFVRALRNAYPNARITWLAGKGRTAYAGKLAPLVEGLIDEAIEDAGIGSRWGELGRRPLAGRRFDLILDSQRRAVTTLILRRIDHRAFISGCANYLFSDRRPPGAPLGGYRKPPAMIDQLLELLALARGGRPGAPLDIGGRAALPDPVTAEAARLLPADGTYVVMSPGAGERRKCWPLERFTELGRRLAARGLQPVYLPGPEETEWEETLRQGVPEARLPLAEPGVKLEMEPLLSIALAARALACIANDSGGGHLMAASGTPLISLFGPSSPAKFAPRVPDLTVIEGRTFGRAEMSAIPVEAVERAVEEIRARG